MDRRGFLALTGAAGLATLGLAGPAEAAGWHFYNRRIPEEAHKRMGKMAGSGITSFAFTPSNGWAMVTRNGGYFARNVPDEFFAKLKQLIAAGTRIHCVAFAPGGGWVITGDRAMFARNIPEECYQRIRAYYKAGQQVVNVAFPPAGGNRWVVVGTKTFYARNIDEECFQKMRELGRKQRVTQVAFTPAGGWTVVAGSAFFARRIDDECFRQMKRFSANGWPLHNVAFSPANNGWSLISRG
ncbi:hypothetical protein FH608_030350 [Nonomuraea phyllanthi]|uniref:Uncharacterized protein n=1 Tax=Nonomuraea phyllanthi TaxID=2219224 RepID=A0A5C4W3Z6_9ACTN|nr:WD40 repeat domain-containing protein [Nonomuraea phyllanthi]KAB8191553.1 hypothetical protein FH608_030350 [Nonomuraea phyllanthi]QFY13120.1 hypothetical protein GBF35_47010 [Nonomuraea phyllanthi]